MLNTRFFYWLQLLHLPVLTVFALLKLNSVQVGHCKSRVTGPEEEGGTLPVWQQSEHMNRLGLLANSSQNSWVQFAIAPRRTGKCQTVSKDWWEWILEYLMRSLQNRAQRSGHSGAASLCCNPGIYLMSVPGCGHPVCGGSLVRPSKSWRRLLNQEPPGPSQGGGSCWFIIKHYTFFSFASSWLVGGIAFLPSWTPWASTDDRVGELRAERQQVPSVPGEFLCSQEVQNHHGQCSSHTECPWLPRCPSCEPSAAQWLHPLLWQWLLLCCGMGALCSVCSLLQCSSTCGKGLQSRVVQCMHKVTGRHGSECPVLAKPAAYRQCHQEVCNDRINVNTITSPRLGESGAWGKVPAAQGAAVTVQGQKSGEDQPDSSLKVWCG